MSQLEAINILDQATAQISANRESHALIQTAITTLRKFIESSAELPTS